MSRLPFEDPRTEQVLDQAEDALDRGDPDAAIQLCGQVLREIPDHPGALFLSAEAFHDIGDYVEAENRYRRCTQITRDHPLSWSGLALSLFDQLRFDEASKTANRALRVSDANAEAYYVRAMLRERRGDPTGAARDYRRAWRLDPERHPPPHTLTDAMVESIVTEALLALPDEIREWLRGVPILLDEWPSDDYCKAFDPPRSPAEVLFGLFEGPSLMEADFSGASVGEQLSAGLVTITLYRKNLERLAHDRERLLDEVRVTLLHEIGHYLGLSEQDLADRGMD